MRAYHEVTFTPEQRGYALETLSRKLAQLAQRSEADCRAWLDRYSDSDLQMLMLSPLGLLRLRNFQL